MHAIKPIKILGNSRLRGQDKIWGVMGIGETEATTLRPTYFIFLNFKCVHMDLILLYSLLLKF